MSTKEFYGQLSSFTDFHDLCDLSKYVDLPEDWYVVITDIEGSTQAIREGRYREVNALGVASIVAVLNAVKPLSIPFLFGGDGALLCVPDEVLASTRLALLGTKRLAETQFHLSLRVGIVPARTIQQGGFEIKVGKFQASPHYAQAVFCGGGCTFAEQLIKDKSSDDYRLSLAEQTSVHADFTGFECRWQDIPSPHGESVSLIVKALTSDTEQANKIYLNVLEQIEYHYGHADEYVPLRKENLKLTTRKNDISNEIKIRTGLEGEAFKKSYIKSLPWIIRVGKIIMALRVKNKNIRWGKYKEILIANSDFRKFDDTLRMVISGTSKQREAFTHYLEEQYQAGILMYGAHSSATALVTCVVFDYAENHMHFIDGSNGGYALAAAEMKKRMNVLQTATVSSVVCPP